MLEHEESRTATGGPSGDPIGARATLNAGANDVGGTLMEETIARMAGSQHGSAKTVGELSDGIACPVRERSTTYGLPAA